MYKLVKAAELALEVLESWRGQAPIGWFSAIQDLHKALDSKDFSWQPISTAPELRIVLVYYKNTLGKGRTIRACYYPLETLESDTTESGWADGGWYEESEAYEYLMPLEYDPTHWMFLPLPPEDQ